MILNNSSVIGKILIHGELVLKSPLLIGDGEGETSDNFKDIHVQKNQAGKPFIPGTSLAGALREYFTKINSAPTEKIFGDLDKMQSSIQIEDIELENFEIVSRDGVSIDGFTGIGIKGGKFDYEVVERGAEAAHADAPHEDAREERAGAGPGPADGGVGGDLHDGFRRVRRRARSRRRRRLAWRRFTGRAVPR